MKMTAKFIHVFAVGILILIFVSSFSAPNHEGTAIRYTPIYNKYNVVGYDTVKLKNIIGKNFYDVYDTKVILGEEILNQDELMELFPSCSSHDTVTIVSVRYYPKRVNYFIPYKHSSVVKFNDELFYIQYYNDGQYKKYSIAESGIYKPEDCNPQNTVMCMMKSTPIARSDFDNSDYLAQRFILQNGVITDYQELNFNDVFYWFLSDCYSRDSIPTRYLRDLRYDRPDSLITRYLQGGCYDYLYWKHYRQ